MHTIRNILKIGTSGAILSDEFGSSTGVSLEIMLGTAVTLEFDLRQNTLSPDGKLPPFPLEKIVCGSYYCALDINPVFSDSPLLLEIANISLASAAGGESLFSVSFPDTAVERMVETLNNRSERQMLCEIGGINTDGTALFAWQFPITVRNRVYGGNGTPSTPLTPEYYTAAQVESAISRPLIFEHSTDGNSWHGTYCDGDQLMRIRHGENGLPSEALPLPAGPQGPQGEQGEQGPPFTLTEQHIDYDGVAPVLENMQSGHRYIFDRTTQHISLDVSAVENSPLESEILITFDPAYTDTPAVSFPASVGFVGEPSFESGKSYIINIRNLIAVVAEYAPGVTE